MSAWDDLIRRYRRVHGMTQAVFAELIGVEQATVSRWERGFHSPDLGMQRKLRDLLTGPSVASDRIIVHRVRGAIGAVKLANRRGRNQAASSRAAVLHGVELTKLQTFDYTPFHTEILQRQWQAARDLGFFRGDVASVRVFNTWQPACGGALRYCEGNWTPAFLSDGEIMLLSEFHEVDERTFSGIPPCERLRAVLVDELLQ
jgi:transcriptional regulator with XRE-family HTH domain